MDNKKNFLMILLFGLIFLIPNVQSVSNEGDYFINMGNISQRLYSEKANILFIGDSITTNTATPRIFYGVIRKWSPLNWRGIITQGASGVSDQGTVIVNEPTGSATKISLEAGQNYTLPNGSIIRGWNLGKVAFYNFTANQGSFGTAIRMGVSTPYDIWSDDWTNMTNLTTRFIYLSSPVSNPYEVRIRNHWRNGTLAPAVQPLTLLNTTPFGIYYLENNFTNSDGNVATYMTLTIGSRDELADKAQFFPLATRIFRSDISTGLQIGYTGGGGYTTKSHTREGEFLSIDGDSINTSYNDEALGRWMEINDLNTFLIWLGQNSAGDEWNGISSRNYGANVFSIIQRYTEVYEDRNYSTDRPNFILVSTYDTAVDNVKHQTMENALVNLTVNTTSLNAQIGFINLRKFLNDTNGSWIGWNSSYTGDGIHPSQDGALYFAETLWNQVVLGLTNPTATMNGITWIAESYKVTNSSLGNQAISLNNTGLLSSWIELRSMTNSIAHNRTDLCSGVLQEINSNDGNFNISIESNGFCYVLDNFNFTEGITRENSPLAFVLNNVQEKNFTSTLDDLINATITIDVDECTEVNTISFTPTTLSNSYEITPNTAGYSCNGNKATFPVNNIDSSNFLTLKYNYEISNAPGGGNGGSGGENEIKIFKLEYDYENFKKGEENTITINVLNLSNDLVDPESIEVKEINDSIEIQSFRISEGIYREVIFLEENFTKEEIKLLINVTDGNKYLSEELTIQVSDDSLLDSFKDIGRKASEPIKSLFILIAENFFIAVIILVSMILLVILFVFLSDSKVFRKKLNSG